MTRRRKEIRDAIESASPAEAAPGAPATNVVPAYMLRAFRHREDGLYKRAKEEGDNDLWLSAPLAIEGETRDEEHRSWGLLLSWKDRDGHQHEEAFPRSLFAGECAELRNRLADGGLSMNGCAGRAPGVRAISQRRSGPTGARGA